MEAIAFFFNINASVLLTAFFRGQACTILGVSPYKTF